MTLCGSLLWVSARRCHQQLLLLPVAEPVCIRADRPLCLLAKRQLESRKRAVPALPCLPTRNHEEHPVRSADSPDTAHIASPEPGDALMYLPPPSCVLCHMVSSVALSCKGL